MKILVKARTKAKENKVEQLTQPSLAFDQTKPDLLVYRVSVTEAPVDGKANDAIVRLVSKHFNVPAYAVRIVSGHTTKQKVIEISD